MQLSTKAFTSELEWAARFIEKKSTIPILHNVLLEAERGRLKLTATDLEIAGVTEVEATGKDKWKLTVPAGLTLKYLKRLGNGQVDIEPWGTTGYVTITHGTDEARIAGMSNESYPELPKLTATATAGGLTKAIPRTAFAISTEESRFTLNGALLESNDTGARLVATDGHRQSYAPITYKGEPIRALIPRRALTEISHLKADEVAVGYDDDHLLLEHGNRHIISRKLTGNFPDYNRILPSNYRGFCQLTGADVLAVLQRIDVFCDERSHATQWKVEGGTLTIQASVSETGSAKGSVPVVGNGEGIAIGLNGHYAMDVLRLNEGPIAFCYNQPDNAMEFLNGDGWRVVCMPMRV